MISKLNKNDRDLLASISDYRVLSVKQISALSQRSDQVVRRRMRFLGKEGLIITRKGGYGHGRGRQEDLLFLTGKGAALLVDEGIPYAACTTDKAKDPFIDHLLLVNWFRIHLFQIERAIQELSVIYQSPKPHLSDGGDTASLSEHPPEKGKLKKSADFIPDGVFSITYKGAETKTLLFFLEVDMGTEIIASTDREPRDIRQKILNYQTLFRSNEYKRYGRAFDSELNGFRVLFLVSSAARLVGLCRLVREMPPSDFIWLSDQERMFSHGVSAKIWARGGRNDDPLQSILGSALACDLPVIDKQ
jgi:hypothetical protein